MKTTIEPFQSIRLTKIRFEFVHLIECLAKVANCYLNIPWKKNFPTLFKSYESSSKTWSAVRQHTNLRREEMLTTYWVFYMQLFMRFWGWFTKYMLACILRSVSSLPCHFIRKQDIIFLSLSFFPAYLKICWNIFIPIHLVR